MEAPWDSCVGLTGDEGGDEVPYSSLISGTPKTFCILIS
jgi:hypothetical protein